MERSPQFTDIFENCLISETVREDVHNRSFMRVGIEEFLAGTGGRYRGTRVGLICHQASVLSDLRSSVDALAECPDFELVALFGPQHGVRGEKQDNMVESPSFVDVKLGIPVHSLYGDVRQPTADMLNGLDVLLFDLQDVGARVYTFIWTMTLAMEACGREGIPFLVLDRPNPIGAHVREGPVLQPGFESFVGMHALPLRHGLTAGEVARLCNSEFGVQCELDVVRCSGWRRSMLFDEFDRPFIPPSPNLPTLDSCLVYPGSVLIEGTNLSEGRGTTRPFELVGAPYLDSHEFAAALTGFDLPGVVFRPCCFEPTFQKHAGSVCGGVHIHVVDRDVFRPVETAVAVLVAASRLAPDAFEWKAPPYEYEIERMPIDILWGSSTLREMAGSGAGPTEILADSARHLAEFDERVRPYLLYS